MHGYRFTDYERLAWQLALEVGFTQISTSHKVSPLIKIMWRSRPPKCRGCRMITHLKDGAFGLARGEAGQVGVNRAVRVDGTVEILGHIGQTQMQEGDVFAIHTPGGGGYGGACA